MGIYLNPGKDKFQSIRKKKYIDKSALISCVNANLDTRETGQKICLRILK